MNQFREHESRRDRIGGERLLCLREHTQWDDDGGAPVLGRVDRPPASVGAGNDRRGNTGTARTACEWCGEATALRQFCGQRCDLFPGTGVVARAWRHVEQRASRLVAWKMADDTETAALDVGRDERRKLNTADGPPQLALPGVVGGRPRRAKRA